MRDVAEYVKCSKQILSEPMCLDPQRSQPLKERLLIVWTRLCERGSLTIGGVYARRQLPFCLLLFASMHRQDMAGVPELILGPQ